MDSERSALMEIQNYDVILKDKAVKLISERLVSLGFFVLAPNVSYFCSSVFKNEFKDRISDITREKDKHHYVFIKELTPMNSTVENEYSGGKLLNYQKIALIIFHNDNAYLVRKEDAKLAIPLEEQTGLLFYDAKEMLRL